MGEVLIVDDDKSVTTECKIILGGLGYEAVSTSDCSEDFALVQTSPPSLAIIHLAHERGRVIEIFKSLRLRYPSLYGILIVEKDDFELVVDAMNCGFSRVCIKPLQPEQLKKAVVEIFKNQRVRNEVTRMQTLLPLYRLGQKLLQADSEHEVYDELAEIIRKEFGAPAVSVMMFDKSTGTLRVVAQRGLDTKIVENLQIYPGERIAGKVFSTKTPVIINRESELQSPYKGLLMRPELSASISFPIAHQGEFVGVINVSETESESRFSESDVEMLSIISDQAMMALGNIRFMKEREEQGRIRTLLEQYVSPEVSEMLVKSREDLMDVGSIQDLTVLFADIRNFTLLVQKVSPRQLREFLNTFFEIFTSIVFAHKGMLDKFVGDAALIVFGAPVALEKPTHAAIAVAHELEEQFAMLLEQWVEVHPVFKKISLGVGITRGPLFLGNIGSQKRVDYTVIGTEVNIAQRLASETDVGRILLTKEACEDLYGDFPLEPLGEMVLRGMTTAVEVYKLCYKQL